MYWKIISKLVIILISELVQHYKKQFYPFLVKNLAKSSHSKFKLLVARLILYWKQVIRIEMFKKQSHFFYSAVYEFALGNMFNKMLVSKIIRALAKSYAINSMVIPIVVSLLSQAPLVSLLFAVLTDFINGSGFPDLLNILNDVEVQNLLTEEDKNLLEKEENVFKSQCELLESQSKPLVEKGDEDENSREYTQLEIFLASSVLTLGVILYLVSSIN